MFTGSIVLDTQAVLWFLQASSKLSDVALKQITQPGRELYFSHASVWEIVIKHASGKLELASPPESFLIDQLSHNKIRLLPISIASIFYVGKLPHFDHHKDPFDRLIAAQCLRHDLTLISIDRAFDLYGVRRAPTTVLADATGRIVERLVGPEAVRDFIGTLDDPALHL